MEIEVHGCRYYVEVSGKGKPLLLLHGFTGNVDTWTETIAYLRDHYLCVTVDIIGHGKSSCPADEERYKIELAARDMIELMNKLGYAKFHLLGYSMGGRLALTMAALFPDAVESLLLESASPGLKTEEERLQRRKGDAALAERIEREGMEAFIDYWQEISLFATQRTLPSVQREAIRQQRLQNSVKGLSSSLKGMGTGSQPSWWEALPRLSMPVLLITGTEDKKFTKIAAEMAQLLPSAVWKEINRAGHAIHVEDSAKFGTIIKEFLSHT
ncbi:2-succinyl-6-hydroxy-2,4-cyclohexadiene-1-carboxylate synthase [Bacillus sp. FJAT-27231]|uniref:2-succinyl-6-hydroxy-2, 4-cyclohexadiene-1-carboxylate synthase n=1 Tax=Bacillus sp. FJAT-27231 TaxID=1679168 RepID=UPI000A85A4C3